MQDRTDEELWDERYRSRTALWSGAANRHLVAEVAELAPGTALDVGSGEGADAIWLARRGWTVTAVDISSVALERAAGHAAAEPAAIRERIIWRHQDMTDWDPGDDGFDLVTAQYLHLPAGPRDELYRRLASAVAPGGTLLVVGHHPSDLQTTMPRPPRPELFFTGGDLVALLEPGSWRVITAAAVPHEATDLEGRAVTVHDTVLCARRR